MHQEVFNLIKIWVTLFLILFSFNLNFKVSAHSYVKESNPTEGEVVKESLELIDITFETEIETLGELSLSNNNQTVEVKNITIEDDRLIGKLEKPLENGQYKATWKIVGEDGHPLEGTISFTVQTPEPVQNESVNENKIEKNRQEMEQSHQEQNKELESLPASEQKENSITKKWLLPLATITILIMTLFIFRKDKK